MSFDVKSLFTSVPLEKTIDIALERIYLRKEIVTILTKNEMKNLLILCTKNVHFTFNNDIYIQNDGVAMRSPLGPILAGIFMVELKNTLVPKLKQHIKTWRRYVDDTFVYVKNGSIEYVLLAPESFHPNIKFTYEKEVNNTLPFLDVLFIRNSNHIHTTVYRKETNNDLYLHWHAFTPISWKRGTIRTLVNRAYVICSDNNYLQQELKHLERVFHIQNGYPLWIIKQIMKEVKQNKRSLVTAQNDTPLQNTNNDRKIHSLILVFAGAKGNTMPKSMNGCINALYPTMLTHGSHTLDIN